MLFCGCSLLLVQSLVCPKTLCERRSRRIPRRSPQCPKPVPKNTPENPQTAPSAYFLFKKVLRQIFGFLGAHFGARAAGPKRLFGRGLGARACVGDNLLETSKLSPRAFHALDPVRCPDASSEESIYRDQQRTRANRKTEKKTKTQKIKTKTLSNILKKGPLYWAPYRRTCCLCSRMLTDIYSTSH